MNKLMLVLVPLSLMFMLSTLSMLGLGSNPADFSGNFTLYDQTTSMGDDGHYLILYGQQGNPLCYWNGTVIAGHNDNGKIIQSQGSASSYVNLAFWGNSTYASALYYDQSASQPVKYTDTATGWYAGRSINPDNPNTYTLTDSLTWVVIIGVIMALAAVAGIKIFGSGESDGAQKTILVGTFALTLWGMLTAMAYPLVLEAGFWIFIVYGFLGFIYLIGVFAMMVGD